MKFEHFMYVTGFFLFIGVMVAGSIHSGNVQEERARDNRFIGACDLLKGTVHDDLCIRDGRVVLTKEK